MSALATPADVETRLGRAFTDAELMRISAVLDDVSATVRAYTGRQFGSGSHTTRFKSTRGVIWLPETPVSAVASVKDINGQTVAFQWDGLDKVYVYPYQPINAFEINLTVTAPYRVFDVTYTGGSATVPADIVAVVCQMAGRVLSRSADDSGVQQESIAGYSYSVGAAAAAGAAGMMNDEKAVLDRYRRVGNTVMVQ